MISEITAALSGLKTALDIAQTLNTRTAVDAVKIDLQQKIVDAMTALNEAAATHSAQAKRIDSLEAEIVQLKAWDGEKKRYELKDVYRGAFAFVLKPGMEQGQPPHWLCANCFERRHKSYLQFRGQDQGPNGSRGETSSYGCDICKGTVKVSYRGTPASLPAA